MERRRTILLACAAIAGAAMLCGCSKTEGGMHLSGAIQFGMASRGGQSTKTVYGDDVEKNNKKYQALNWAEGDVVTIASPQAVVQNDPNAAHASNYVISQVTATGVPSRAKVVNEAANGLMWLDNIDTYDFYGIYPKHQTGLITLTQNGAVEATIPEEQTNEASEKTKKSKDESVTYTVYEPDMNYAFMIGALKSFKPKSNTQIVPLRFYPAFTAFEFNVSSQDDPIEITEIQLEAQGSDVLSGTFSTNAADSTLASVNASGKKTATLKTTTEKQTEVDGETVTEVTGVGVTATEGASFTLFTLPKDNTQALKLRVTSKDGDATKTSYVMLTYAKEGKDLDAETTHAAKTPVVFKAGHKYRINMLKLPSSQWKITISVHLEPWETGEETVIYI
ncbi:MAG: hypothetical protein IJL73_08145 [Lachnospiraceae bacterium]|nr:hypothetical protein [Lachnospiraceae bacterium]